MIIIGKKYKKGTTKLVLSNFAKQIKVFNKKYSPMLPMRHLPCVQRSRKSTRNGFYDNNATECQ